MAFSESEMGYSIPSSAPLYLEPPYEYRNCWWMTIVFKSTPEVLKELVPEPLEPNPDNIVMVFLGSPRAAGLGPYHEAVIAVPAKFRDMSGRYAAYLYLDSDIPIANGREIWGWPKKHAQFTITEANGMIRTTVERGGVEIIKASVVLAELIKEPEKSPPPPPYFNLKIIPSVKLGAPPEVKQLTITKLENYAVKTGYTGSATLEFGMSPADPLHRIEVVQVLAGYYVQNQFDLPHGDVLYNYLQ
jgi:acetoacetate decarboxylase